MTDHVDIVDALNAYADRGERCGRVTAGRAAETLTAYRSVALHYMNNDCIVDCRAVGGSMTWSVNGAEVTPGELTVLRELWAELGMPDELDEILGEGHA